MPGQRIGLLIDEAIDVCRHAERGLQFSLEFLYQPLSAEWMYFANGWIIEPGPSVPKPVVPKDALDRREDCSTL